jgi:hypothetical protein
MRWQDLPAAYHKRGCGSKNFEPSQKYEAEAALLRAHRGRWALLEEYPIDSTPRTTLTSLVHNITVGDYAALRPAYHFEVAGYTNRDTGRYEAYIRYVGEPEWE